MPRVLKQTYTKYSVFGCSWKGNLTKRDGKAVWCGHLHDSAEDAGECHARMLCDRPGRCQQYRVSELVVEVREKKGG